jgi:hypothetical protein
VFHAAQPAKTTLFASGNEADVRKTAGAPSSQAVFLIDLQPVGLACFMLRSWQKPRFLPAETEPVSEKRPQAVFLMD